MPLVKTPPGHNATGHNANQPTNNLFSAIKTITIRTLQTTAEGYQRSHRAQWRWFQCHWD